LEKKEKNNRAGAVLAAPPAPSPASMRGEWGGDEASVVSGGGGAVGGGGDGAVGGGSWLAVGEGARREKDVIPIGKRGGGAWGGGQRSAGRPRTTA
jgi:hypothetical protein